MVISKVSNSRISLSRVVISATAEQIRLFLFGLTMFTIKSTLAKIKGFLFRTSSSFRSRSYQMAIKCFLTSCLFGFVRPSLVLTSCLVSFFLLPVCQVVGGVLLKKKRSFDPSSLFVTETTVEIHSESCRPI